MITNLLLAAIVLSAILAIYFKQTGNTSYFALFKPLTTILIIGLSVIFNLEEGTHYGWIITSGLLFSLVGDICLLKEKRFVQGLGAFLVAHIIFTYAFASLHGFQLNYLVLLAFVLIGGLYFNFLRSSLKEFALPVALYFIAIIVMNWQAVSLSVLEQGNVFYWIGIGSILFTFSDAVIAYNKFIKPFKLAQVLILSTYWSSILIFCLSCSQL